MNNYNYQETSTNVGLQTFFARVYAYLGVGVAISGVTSYLVLNVFAEQVFGMMVGNTTMKLLLLWVVEIALVLFLSAKSVKNPGLAFAGFIAYAVINGVTLSFTLAMYTGASVVKAFVAASLTFITMAIVGSVSKKDLSGMGHAMRSALIGIIIVILINIFLKSSALDMFVSIATVLVFSGLTAYDHQNIKRMYYQVGNTSAAKGVAINCALQLYLDFINLLIAFLRIFGSRD